MRLYDVASFGHDFDDKETASYSSLFVMKTISRIYYILLGMNLGNVRTI